MKKWLATGTVIALLSTSVSSYALSPSQKAQKDTAVGAVIGGVAGAMIGNDVSTTLAGAALGGVVGSQWNNNQPSHKPHGQALKGPRQPMGPHANMSRAPQGKFDKRGWDHPQGRGGEKASRQGKVHPNFR